MSSMSRRSVLMLALLVPFFAIGAASTAIADHHAMGKEAGKARAAEMKRKADRAAEQAAERAAEDADKAAEAVDEAGQAAAETAEEAIEAAEETREAAKEKAQEGMRRAEEAGKAADARRADEMKSRRDERKKIMEEAKAAREPGSPQKGKKPWWRFWGDPEQAAEE